MYVYNIDYSSYNIIVILQLTGDFFPVIVSYFCHKFQMIRCVNFLLLNMCMREYFILIWKLISEVDYRLRRMVESNEYFQHINILLIIYTIDKNYEVWPQIYVLALGGQEYPWPQTSGVCHLPTMTWHFCSASLKC